LNVKSSGFVNLDKSRSITRTEYESSRTEIINTFVYEKTSVQEL